MSRINRVPWGLQDLLGAQNLGVNPSDLSTVVAPTAELWPFWAPERMTEYGVNGLVVNNSTIEMAVIAVPTGEMWAPIHVVVDCDLAASGDSFDVGIIVRRPGNIGAGSVGPALNTTIAVSGPVTATAEFNKVYASHFWPQPVFYPSGVEFAFRRRGGDIVGADGIGAARVFYYRLET